jgi:hypothetical protein
MQSPRLVTPLLGSVRIVRSAEVEILPKPNSVFFDEAHLLGSDAPQALFGDRTGGPPDPFSGGVYFVTQPARRLTRCSLSSAIASARCAPSRRAIRRHQIGRRNVPRIEARPARRHRAGKGEALVSFLEANGTPSLVSAAWSVRRRARPITPEQRSGSRQARSWANTTGGDRESHEVLQDA